MAGLWTAVCETFWNEKFWLPPNVTWNGMKNTTPGIYKPQLSDLLTPVYLCFVICIVRIGFERFVSCTFGKYFNLRNKVRKAPENAALEAAYLKSKICEGERLKALSKQTDMREREIERWFRLRRNQSRTPVMKKFCESSWRMTYYAALFFYGAHTLWDKPWLWDTNECWRNWPEHHTPDDVYWYYAVQAGFYLALSVTLFFDHKRKDFTEMIVHHFATLLLMFLSWTINFVRVGTLVLLVHDCVDPLLEGAKMAKYAKKDGLCTLLFVLFFLTWIVTRMMLYPFRIIRSTLFEAVPYVGMSDIYYAFNFLLITLQILHIIWFYFILLIAKEALFQGEFKKDSRSSDESVSDDNTPKESLSDITADKNGLKGLEQNGLSGHKTSQK